MKSYKIINNIVGWAVFLVSAIVFLLTIEPTTSFWDCGEFIASSYKLQVGHPPGAPFFQLVQKVVSLFATGTDKVAMMMNAFSALASAGTVLFLYWTIVRLANHINNSEKTSSQIVKMAAGVVGALAFSFSDTFWFSAVEAEVYAFSSLFTAVVFWAILKWEEVADEPHSNRWIILIAYLVGLSIGVHLLNLLAIPAIAYIWYYKKYKPTRKGLIVTLVLSAAIIGFIMYGIVQGTPTIAQKFEILFVNSFGLPYNSGMLFFLVLLFGALIWVTIYSHKKQKAILNMIALSVMVIYFGFGSYALIMVRSNANPPLDENNPENTYMLMKYLNRSQYGKTPLISGYYFNAPAIGVEEGAPVYYPKDGKYVKGDAATEYKYDSRFKTVFPRMYSSMQSAHESGYKMWGKIQGRSVSINGKVEKVPTFSENLRYFFSYQLNFMYIRYFMWNFSGRQNDKQGQGDVLNGNWISGIGFLDKARLGHTGDQPSSLSNPETTNKYYMLPFLLGLIGFVYQFKKDKNNCWVVALLFLMTGVAIVVYLNQPPYQPRERDYAYVGSFYAYAIWIGLGVLGLASFFEKYLKDKAFIPAVLLGLIVPGILLAENYDDHDRSNRYLARDIGYNYLNSCDKNAVLFTYGDNDTFPLWYDQDVEGERTDVRICNATLLNGDWYVDQMKNKAYESDPLAITMDRSKYEFDTRNVTIVRNDIKRPLNIEDVVNLALSDNSKAKLKTSSGMYNYIPGRTLYIPVDKQKVVANGTVAPEQANMIVDSVIVTLKGNYVTKSDLAILDLLAHNHWERPIYFDNSVVGICNIKLDGYWQQEGFAYRLMPIKNPKNTDILYDRLMNKYQWGNLNDPDIYLDYNTHRTIEVVRTKDCFYKLSDDLIRENKFDKAKDVLDRVYEILPTDRFYTSYYDLLLVSNYYKINEFETGDSIMMILADDCTEKIDFYLGLGPEYISQYQQNIKREISITREVVRVADRAKRENVSSKIKSDLDMLIQRFESM